MLVKEGKPKKAAEMNPDNFRKSVLFSQKSEKKFFSLLKVLILPDNIDDARKYKQTIDNYAMHLLSEKPEESQLDDMKHFNEISNKVKLLQKNILI